MGAFDDLVPQKTNSGAFDDLIPTSSSSPAGVPGLSTTGAEFTPPDLPDRETRATRELPELGSGGLLSGLDSLSVAKVAPLILLTTNPEEVGDILNSNFDDIGITSDEKGNKIATNNKTGVAVVINQPGLSKIDLLQGLGLATSFTGGARLGQAASKVGAFGLQGLKAGVLGGAAGAGATQSGIEVAQQAAGGQIDRGDIALATGLGGAAETIVPAAQALGRRSEARRLGVETADVAETIERIKSAREAVAGLKEATGRKVGLFPAQQTLNPASIIKQKFLPGLSPSAKKAMKELEQQNKEVFDATMNLVNKVAPEGVTATGSARFRSAAKKALVTSVKERSAAVKPLYDDAFKEARINGQEVDLKPVADFVKNELKGLVSDDPATKALNSFMRRLKGVKEKDTPASSILDSSGKPMTEAVAGKVKPLSLEQLQSAKRTTDAAIDKSGGLILNSAQKNAKRLLTQAEKLYVSQIGKVSPKFKAANEEFARLSPAVQELEDSIVGQVSNIKDVNLKDIAGKIFDATETNPTVIKQAKKVIEEADPGAWSDLMRVQFQRRVGGISARVDDHAGDLSGSTPGQLRSAIFGNDNQRKVLFAGMNNAQKKNFVWLETVLKRAESGRAPGSQTMEKQEGIKELRGAFKVLKGFMFNTIEVAQEAGESIIFTKNTNKLAEMMFNPKWEPKVRELGTLNPNSEQAAKILTELFEVVKPAAQTSQIEEEL